MFFRRGGEGNCATVTAIIQFFLTKLKIFFFFFLFLWGFRFTPTLSFCHLGYAGLRSKTHKTVCTFILFKRRVNTVSYLVHVRISFVSLYPPSPAQSASRASQRENSTAIDLFDKNDFGRKVQNLFYSFWTKGKMDDN